MGHKTVYFQGVWRIFGKGKGATSGDLYPSLGSCLLCWKKLGFSSSPRYIKQDECDVSFVSDYIRSSTIVYNPLHSLISHDLIVVGGE